MTTAKALRVNDLRIAGTKLRASIGEAVTEITVNYAVDTVAEIAITALDPQGRLRRGDIAELGSECRMVGYPGQWRVGSIEAAYGPGVMWTFRARSSVAQALRKTFKAKAETKVSPTEWVTRQVREAGGTTVAQQSNKRLAIGQAGGDDQQSVLEVIGSLAAELGWRWLEVDGVVCFGEPHWAWQGGPALPSWRVTWKIDERTDALSLTAVASDDDLELAGTLDLTLPNAYGRQLRPWHRLELRGTAYDGTWLVESVDITEDSATPVMVAATIPRKPRRKKGSSE